MSERLLPIFQESYRELRPRAPIPELQVKFYAFANINNTIRLREGKLLVRISDLLEGAPEPILRALAHILLAKLYRKPIEREHSTRYRRYVSSHDITQKAHLMRQRRGRKRIESPKGRVYDLEEIFEKLNARFFYGLLARPQMTWSRSACAQYARALRSGTQCDRGQQGVRPTAGAGLRGGIHRLSRDAAFEASGEIAGKPEVCALGGVSGRREAISASGQSQVVLEAFVGRAPD